MIEGGSLLMQARKLSVFTRYALAASLAAAPVATAFAQRSPTPGTPQEQGQRQPKPGSLTVPVNGLVGAEGSTAPLAGTFKIQRFARSDSGIAVVGTLTANITDTESGTARTVVTQIPLPVALEEVAVQAQTQAQTQACGSLHLVLGPLDFDLLGRQVQLDRVALDVTAVQGAGNLLSNQVCEISSLLGDASQAARGDASQSTRLVALLNQLLDVLG